MSKPHSTSRNTSGGGSSSADPKALSLRDLDAHYDPGIAALAKQAASTLPPQRVAEPVEALLNSLVNERDSIPDKDPRLTHLDNTIVPLTQLVRKMFAGGPYSVFHESAPAPPSPGSPIMPAVGPHLLQDLTHANLISEASDLLGIKHLSDAQGTVQFPVPGILYGPCSRPLVCLPTAIGSRPPKNIIYLVGTGAPITDLSPHAFVALGATEAVPSAAFATINGVRHQVKLCEPRGNHPDIPVLGADAMTALGLELRINYGTREVALHLA